MSEQPMEHKDLTFEIKDDAKGEVESIIATLGVVDKDGDIISPDAIKNGAKVAMSSYGHDAMFGDMPVGKGTVSIVDNKAVFKGKLFMDTMRGKETYTVLKGMGSDQQWSFGFRVIGSEVPDEAASKQGARRILTKLDAFEVSPVMIGAGIGTRTTAMKEADEEVERAAAEKAESDRIAAEAAAKLQAEAELKAFSESVARDYARFERTMKRRA